MQSHHNIWGDYEGARSVTDIFENQVCMSVSIAIKIKVKARTDTEYGISVDHLLTASACASPRAANRIAMKALSMSGKVVQPARV